MATLGIIQKLAAAAGREQGTAMQETFLSNKSCGTLFLEEGKQSHQNNS